MNPLYELTPIDQVDLSKLDDDKKYIVTNGKTRPDYIEGSYIKKYPNGISILLPYEPSKVSAEEILDSKFVNGMANTWKLTTRNKILAAMEECLLANREMPIVSDEKIEVESFRQSDLLSMNNRDFKLGFITGAKWMREKSHIITVLNESTEFYYPSKKMPQSSIDQQIIEFAEWISENGYYIDTTYTDSDGVCWQIGDGLIKTTEMLLILFKNKNNGY